MGESWPGRQAGRHHGWLEPWGLGQLQGVHQNEILPHSRPQARATQGGWAAALWTCPQGAQLDHSQGLEVVWRPGPLPTPRRTPPAPLLRPTCSLPL